MWKRRAVLFLAVVTLLIAALLSPLASSAPDGLERVGEDLGFMERARDWFAAPLADYSWPGVPDSLAGPLAGVTGVAITLLVVFGLGKLFTR